MALRIRACDTCDRSRIVELLDHFTHKGPNGVHVCMVFELMWVSVANFLGGQEDWHLRLVIIRAVVKQALEGLRSLAKMGIIHNGTLFKWCKQLKGRFPTFQPSYHIR